MESELQGDVEALVAKVEDVSRKRTNYHDRCCQRRLRVGAVLEALRRSKRIDMASSSNTCVLHAASSLGVSYSSSDLCSPMKHTQYGIIYVNYNNIYYIETKFCNE